MARFFSIWTSRTRGVSLARPVSVIATVLALLVGATGVATASVVGKRPSAPPRAGLNLAKLGSLVNYSATVFDNGIEVGLYRFHSSSDWEEFTAKSKIPLSVDVGGWQYLRIPKISGSKLTYSWQKSGKSPPYAMSPYPSYARGFADLTHVTGVRLVEGAMCHQAGLVGRLWHFAPAAAGAAFPRVSSCIATHSGALLTYDEAPIQRFFITGVGHVAVVRVP